MTGSNQSFELLVAVHVDNPKVKSVLVSADGESKHAVWIARSLLRSLGLTGQTTRGTDQNGQFVSLPIANITIPEWFAIKKGLA